MEEETLSWVQKLSNAITERFGDGIGSIAMKIVAALVILIVGLLIVKLIIKLIRKSKWYNNLASEVQTFAVSAVKVLGYTLVILLAVATVGELRGRHHAAGVPPVPCRRLHQRRHA